MGLDMYLSAEKYVGGWNHSSPEEKALFSLLQSVTGLTPTEHSPSFYVKVTVGYWRKANQIHKWFVDNVMDGEDTCVDHYVSREKLDELLQICRTILQRLQAGEPVQDVGEELLPTQSGFFFGSTEYNDFYVEDVSNTVEILTRVLKDPALNDCSFYYTPSW